MSNWNGSKDHLIEAVACSSDVVSQISILDLDVPSVVHREASINMRRPFEVEVN